MACNLLAADFDVVAWNRGPEPLAGLVSRCPEAGSPAVVAAEAIARGLGDAPSA